ncbi:TPA: hypothetical protein ACGOX3_002299, partial [Streptococcus suis]
RLVPTNLFNAIIHSHILILFENQNYQLSRAWMSEELQWTSIRFLFFRLMISYRALPFFCAG